MAVDLAQAVVTRMQLATAIAHIPLTRRVEACMQELCLSRQHRAHSHRAVLPVAPLTVATAQDTFMIILTGMSTSHVLF